MRKGQNIIRKKDIIATLEKRIQEKRNKIKEHLDKGEINLHLQEIMSIFGMKEAIEIIKEFREEPGEVDIIHW